MPDLEAFVFQTVFDDLPADVLAIMQRSVLDTIGVAAVGSQSEISKITTQYAKDFWAAGGNAPSASLMFDGSRVSPSGAAFAGAFMLDSIDAHDGHSPVKGHAGSAIFPALIGFCEAREYAGNPVSGQEFITAMAIGYEIGYRSGLTLHATQEDYHTSGAWTAVGVAAMGARLLGLTHDQMLQAIGIAEYHGPRSQMMRCIDFPTMLRDGVGWGAPSGVTAAYLAREGFTGAPALTCEGEEAAPFWDGLGERWLTLEHTHYKLYPCCRWAHSSIDGAQKLMQDNGLVHTDVARVEIRTFHYATRLAGYEPKTLDEFSYSIAFPVAAMIVRGQVGVPELAEETLQDPEILRISQATRLIDDPHLTEISVGKRWALVTIVMKDGMRFTSPPRTPRGDTDLPLSDAEIAEKFHLFADPVLGVTRANELQDLSGSFDSLSAAEFSRLLDLCLTKP
mgnify:CR=1 FL=1